MAHVKKKVVMADASVAVSIDAPFFFFCWKSSSGRSINQTNRCKDVLSIVGLHTFQRMSSEWVAQKHKKFVRKGSPQKFAFRFKAQHLSSKEKPLPLPLTTCDLTPHKSLIEVWGEGKNVGKYQNGTLYTRVSSCHQWKRLVLFGTPWLKAAGENRRVEEGLGVRILPRKVFFFVYLMYLFVLFLCICFFFASIYFTRMAR